MKTFIFTDTKHNSLMEPLTIISGKSPVEAIRNHLQGVKIRRAKDDDEKRLCDYIVEECVVDGDGKARIKSRAPRCCYIRDN